MPYQYRYPGSKQADDFELQSFGRDKVPGGDGDNADIGR